MLNRVILACVAGVIAFLVCILAGSLLAAIGIPLASIIGAFLIQWATAIAILVALWHFFSGGGIPFRKAG
ncbi:MAG TPA: hypothetical protein VGR85_03085 [Candidatus Limnocylindria bacterium]|nr:hypothetical protein [Candidatus Limnocylindria bacterium]